MFSNKRNLLLGEMGLGQRKHRTIQEHLVVPVNKGSKKMLGEVKKTQEPT